MNPMNFRGVLKLTLALGMLAAVAGSEAKAGFSLPPGQSVTTPGEAYLTTAPGATLLATQTITFTPAGNPLVLGSLQVEVFRETGGTLDFLYQLTNTGSSAIGGISIAAFGDGVPNFTTLVDYATDSASIPGFVAGTQITFSATRSAAGPSINFSFDSPGVPGQGLASGATSFVFFVQTNATAFNAFGSAQIAAETIGGNNPGANSSNGVFQPTLSPVPEPSSLVLCGLAGVIGLGVHRFRRGR